MSRSLSVRFIAHLAVLGALSSLAPAPARALSELYFIDPSQSFIAIAEGSGIAIDVGGSLIELPFSTQLGRVAGVSGNVLPGIGLSDGLTTTLSGQLQVDYVAGHSIRFFRGASYVLLDESGSWSPDASGTPAPAQGGAWFGGSFGIRGTAALRGAAFHFDVFTQPVVPTGPGTYAYDGFAAVDVIAGGFDYETNLLGLDGQGALDETSAVVGFQPGLIQELDADTRRITLPFEITFVADDVDGLPLDLTLVLEGQIVATNRPIPEPTSALLLGAGLAGAALARRPRQGVDRATP